MYCWWFFQRATLGLGHIAACLYLYVIGIFGRSYGSTRWAWSSNIMESMSSSGSEMSRWSDDWSSWLGEFCGSGHMNKHFSCATGFCRFTTGAGGAAGRCPAHPGSIRMPTAHILLNVFYRVVVSSSFGKTAITDHSEDRLRPLSTCGPVPHHGHGYDLVVMLADGFNQGTGKIPIFDHSEECDAIFGPYGILHRDLC